MIPNMKQIQQMQARMQAMQERITEMEVEGESGGGLVKLVVTGKGDLKSVKLDRKLLDPEEVEVLEDLIVAAFQNGKSKLDQAIQDETQKAMGGLKLPGMKLPF